MLTNSKRLGTPGRRTQGGHINWCKHANQQIHTSVSKTRFFGLYKEGKKKKENPHYDYWVPRMEQILRLAWVVVVDNIENMEAQRTVNVPPTQALTHKTFCLWEVIVGTSHWVWRQKTPEADSPHAPFNLLITSDVSIGGRKTKVRWGAEWN